MKIIIKECDVFKNKKIIDKKIKIIRLSEKNKFLKIKKIKIENLYQVDENRKIYELEYLKLKSDDIIEIEISDVKSLLENTIIKSQYLVENKIRDLNYLFFEIGSEYSLEFYQKISSEEKLDIFYKELCENLEKIEKGELIEKKLIYMINKKILNIKEITKRENIDIAILKEIWEVIKEVLSKEEEKIRGLKLSEEFNLFLRAYTFISLKSKEELNIKGQVRIKDFEDIIKKIEQEKDFLKLKEMLLLLISSKYISKRNKKMILVKYFQLKLLPKVHDYNLNTDVHTMYMLLKDLEEEREVGLKSELYNFLYLNYLSSKQGNLTENEKIKFINLKKKYEDNQEKDMQYDSTKRYDLKKQYLFLSILEENIESLEELKKEVLAYIKWIKQVIKKKIFNESDLLILFLTSNFKTMILYKYLFLEKIQFIKEIRDKSEANRTNSILRGEDIGVNELEKILKDFDEVLECREDIKSKYNLIADDRNYIINSFYISNLLYNRFLKHFDRNELIFPIYEKVNFPNRISNCYYIENQLVENIDFYPLEDEIIEEGKNYVFYKEGIQKGETLLFIGKCLSKTVDGILVFKLIGADLNYFRSEKPPFIVKEIFILEKERIIGILKRIEYSR